MSQINERYLRNQTVTPNEVREMIGLPQIRGGDEMIDLSPAQAAQERSKQKAGTTRAVERTAQQSDGEATIDGRNPKGEGRKTS